MNKITKNGFTFQCNCPMREEGNSVIIDANGEDITIHFPEKDKLSAPLLMLQLSLTFILFASLFALLS